MARHSRRVEVTIGESTMPVGELRFETDGRRQTSVFRYANRWLESPAPFAIAPTMPLADAVFYSAASRDQLRSALPGAVGDGAPDSWGRSVTRHANPGTALSELDYLLLADDATRQGALRYRDEAGTPLASGGTPVPRLHELADLRALAQRAGEAGLSELERSRLAGSVGSLGGARPKANVRDESGRLFIAKFTAENDTMPIERAEVATLELARMAGVDAASARLELPRTDRPVALVERFDRTADGHRVGYLSAQSFLGVVAGDSACYTDIADALRAHGHDPKAQLTELFQRILFTILVSNNDDHLKNHGLLHVGHGRWALAPAFDINPQPFRRRQLETGISEQSGNAASIEVALQAASFFDLAVDAAAGMLARMARIVAGNWRRCFERAGLSAEEAKRYAPAFHHEEHRVAARLTRHL